MDDHQEQDPIATLRARSFRVAQHITGEKRPVVFLHAAEAEVDDLREQLAAIINAFREPVSVENAPAKVYELQSKIERLTADLQRAVILDDDALAKLDQRAVLMGIDRAGYLRWVLTGRAPVDKKATT